MTAKCAVYRMESMMSRSKSEREKKSIQTILIRVCLIGSLLLGISVAKVQSQEVDSEDYTIFDANNRDLEIGDSHGERIAKCLDNDARKRGTIGSLFQWSGAISTSEPWRLASDEPLATDRPDFTEASSVVGLGVLQIETGYTYFFDNDGTDQTIGHSYPETLLRYGIFANWLEFRLATNFGTESVNGVGTSGAEDLYLGFKIGLTQQSGWRPEMSLIPQMTVPTGSNAFTGNEVHPGVNWLYGWDINDTISTAGSTQFNDSTHQATGLQYAEFAQSWTIGYSLTERLGGYTEYFGFFPKGNSGARVEHYFDGGMTFRLTDDLQFDIRGGKGLNDSAADYFFGTGLGIRFH